MPFKVIQHSRCSTWHRHIRLGTKPKQPEKQSERCPALNYKQKYKIKNNAIQAFIFKEIVSRVF
jgi:hypothetical protein